MATEGRGSLGLTGGLLKQMQDRMREEPKAGNPELPAGIKRGVGELRECKLGQYQEGENKGQDFWLANAVVLLPVEYAGMRTQIMEPLCDTPKRGGEKSRKTRGEHWEWVLDQMRILGRDGQGGPTHSWSDDYLRQLLVSVPGESEQVADARVTAGLQRLMELLKHPEPKDLTKRIRFYFRTWSGAKQVASQDATGRWRVFDVDDKGKPTTLTKLHADKSWATKEMLMKAMPYIGRDPLVNHEWNGAVPSDFVLPVSPTQKGRGTVDRSAETTVVPQPSANGTGGSPPAVAMAVPPADESDEPTPQEALPAGATDADNLIADLVEACGDNLEPDEGTSEYDAASQLVDMAKAVGVTDDQLKAAVSWQQVADMLGLAQAGNIGPTTSAEAVPAALPEFVPERGKMYLYQLLDKEGKPAVNPISKKVRKPVEVEAVSVSKAKHTVDIASKDGKVAVKGVPWAALIR